MTLYSAVLYLWPHRELVMPIIEDITEEKQSTKSESINDNTTQQSNNSETMNYEERAKHSSFRDRPSDYE
jgi:hypothetical protein